MNPGAVKKLVGWASAIRRIFQDLHVAAQDPTAPARFIHQEVNTQLEDVGLDTYPVRQKLASRVLAHFQDSLNAL